MNKKIAIIDYQLGNLFSVQQACLYLGYDAYITSDPKSIINADYAILPGVGAFADSMINMEKLDLIEPIKDFVASGKPFMGICLGLQLLLTESEEFGNSKGLNLIEGVVKRFSNKDTEGAVLKVPQIAWNQIYEPRKDAWVDTPLSICKEGDYMYFVHSFYAQPTSSDVILSTTNYGGYDYCSSVIKDNIFACQFHPEKSGQYGVKIYENWVNYSELSILNK
jgi:imidazole glycerol-phosphate synthase subunit HisH